MARSDDRDPLIGKTLGGCLLQERVGRGGMGTVYRALDQNTHCNVALKILAPFLTSEPAVVARFLREARSASRIDHPNIVRMHVAAQEDGLYFTIMDFVDGQNLSEVLRREGPLPAGRSALIAHDVAKGLGALHAEGIVHRDVKPANILLGRDGSTRITDFGISWDASELQRLTATGDLLGTLGFAAPEQLHQAPADIRSDLYSLGATLHFMLTGVRPPMDPRIPHAEIPADVPVPIRTLVEQLLSKNPEDRPKDAETVASVLAPFAEKQRPSSTIGKRLLRAGLMVGGGVLAYLAGSIALLSRGEEIPTQPWTIIFPSRESILLTALLFGSGILAAFFALLKDRRNSGLSVRFLIGSSFLAGSLVLSYVSGASLGTIRIWKAASTLISLAPEVLFPDALALASFGLYLAMKTTAGRGSKTLGMFLVAAAFAAASAASSPGSLSQAIDDFSSSIQRNGWTWLALVMVIGGALLATRHQGSLSTLLLASLAVFASCGLIYWSSQGVGALPLRAAVSGPASAVAFAIVLGFGARAILESKSRAGELEAETSGPPGHSTSTPTPAA